MFIIYYLLSIPSKLCVENTLHFESFCFTQAEKHAYMVHAYVAVWKHCFMILWYLWAIWLFREQYELDNTCIDLTFVLWPCQPVLSLSYLSSWRQTSMPVCSVPLTHKLHSPRAHTKPIRKTPGFNMLMSMLDAHWLGSTRAPSQCKLGPCCFSLPEPTNWAGCCCFRPFPYQAFKKAWSSLEVSHTLILCSQNLPTMLSQ